MIIHWLLNLILWTLVDCGVVVGLYPDVFYDGTPLLMTAMGLQVPSVSNWSCELQRGTEFTKVPLVNVPVANGEVAALCMWSSYPPGVAVATLVEGTTVIASAMVHIIPRIESGITRVVDPLLQMENGTVYFQGFGGAIEISFALTEEASNVLFCSPWLMNAALRVSSRTDVTEVGLECVASAVGTLVLRTLPLLLLNISADDVTDVSTSVRLTPRSAMLLRGSALRIMPFMSMYRTTMSDVSVDATGGCITVNRLAAVGPCEQCNGTMRPALNRAYLSIPTCPLLQYRSRNTFCCGAPMKAEMNVAVMLNGLRWDVVTAAVYAAMGVEPTPTPDGGTQKTSGTSYVVIFVSITVVCLIVVALVMLWRKKYKISLIYNRIKNSYQNCNVPY